MRFEDIDRCIDPNPQIAYRKSKMDYGFGSVNGSRRSSFTHDVSSPAAAEVLIDLFGDKVKYSLTSLTLPGVTRHFKGFSAAAEENGLSRIYAGIHFRYAVSEGRRQGRSIGRGVAETLEPSAKVI